ncbi:hypothetical protein [uncultured Algibacter sp.]|uniref:hypothetical protein n=1 Tax=uncultured Algibacter sp. TaxID=298659 RepID=UPI00261694F1|nr:hypothetical protein [uncultured Algibacter sp.]
MSFSYKNIFLLFFFLTTTLYSQIDISVETALTKELEELSSDNITDVVYLQTDKDVYFTDENVWFKGSVLDDKMLIPSNKSSILFVQLIEEKNNKPVWEEKYEIENGFVDGHLFLSDTLSIGNYSLTAYSSHSFFKNQKDFYALKKIKIIDKETKTVNAIKQDSIIHFVTFPEGGHLVSGIESRLRLKRLMKKAIL